MKREWRVPFLDDIHTFNETFHKPESPVRRSRSGIPYRASSMFSLYMKIICNDVKVKGREKALSIVNMHKQPQDHCAAPKEMLRAWYYLLSLPGKITVFPISRES